MDPKDIARRYEEVVAVARGICLLDNSALPTELEYDSVGRVTGETLLASIERTSPFLEFVKKSDRVFITEEIRGEIEMYASKIIDIRRHAKKSKKQRENMGGGTSNGGHRYSNEKRVLLQEKENAAKTFERMIRNLAKIPLVEECPVIADNYSLYGERLERTRQIVYDLSDRWMIKNGGRAALSFGMPQNEGNDENFLARAFAASTFIPVEVYSTDRDIVSLFYESSSFMPVKDFFDEFPCEGLSFRKTFRQGDIGNAVYHRSDPSRFVEASGGN